MIDIKTIDAANAYGNVIKNQGGASSAGGIGSIGSIGSIDDGTKSSNSFADVLTNAIADTNSAVGASSNAGISAMNSDADLVNVVTTVQNAEMVLETVVAVRDKVISAYNDIIKMPI